MKRCLSCGLSIVLSWKNQGLLKQNPKGCCVLRSHSLGAGDPTSLLRLGFLHHEQWGLPLVS